MIDHICLGEDSTSFNWGCLGLAYVSFRGAIEADREYGYDELDKKRREESAKGASERWSDAKRLSTRLMMNESSSAIADSMAKYLLASFSCTSLSLFTSRDCRVQINQSPYVNQ